MRPKKRLGQHFLMDGGAAKRIAQLAVANAVDAGAERPRTIEIGAGTGALSRALLEAGADLTIVEIDDDLVDILRDRQDLAGATIVHGDALAVDYGAFATGPDGSGEPRAWFATGNLPYNVATPLILGWVASRFPPQRITVMVQRDVADRFVARPGTPAYGSLTLAIGYLFEARRAFTLGPGVFYPRPNVESAVVTLERRSEPAVRTRDPAFMLKVVRAAFAYRRKTLANSLFLAERLDRARTQAALASIGLNPEIRAEQIGLDAFGALTDALAP